MSSSSGNLGGKGKFPSIWDQGDINDKTTNNNNDDGNGVEKSSNKTVKKKAENMVSRFKKQFNIKTQTEKTQTEKPKSSDDENDDEENIDSISMDSLMNIIKKYYIFTNLYFKILSFILWIFVIIFFYVFLYQNQDAQHGYYITNAFDVAFGGSALTMQFEDIANIEDTYIYLENCLADGFKDTEDGMLTVGDSNIVTELVFFQNRVRKVECDSVSVVENAYPDPANGTTECIPIYSDDVIEKEPFGPNGEWTFKELDKFYPPHFTYEYSPSG